VAVRLNRFRGWDLIRIGQERDFEMLADATKKKCNANGTGLCVGLWLGIGDKSRLGSFWQNTAVQSPVAAKGIPSETTSPTPQSAVSRSVWNPHPHPSFVITAKRDDTHTVVDRNRTDRIR
jgi:hypothetical protein